MAKKKPGTKASIVVQRKTGPAKTRTKKIASLMAQLRGIEIDIANLAGAGLRKEGGLSPYPDFINHFYDSFTDGGRWWDTFADAPDNTNNLVAPRAGKGAKRSTRRKTGARSKNG